jgi:hypothetical protein
MDRGKGEYFVRYKSGRSRADSPYSNRDLVRADVQVIQLGLNPPGRGNRLPLVGE